MSNYTTPMEDNEFIIVTNINIINYGGKSVFFFDVFQNIENVETVLY